MAESFHAIKHAFKLKPHWWWVCVCACVCGGECVGGIPSPARCNYYVLWIINVIRYKDVGL